MRLGTFAWRTAGLVLVTFQLACGGSCVFGPTCEPEGFVRECNTEHTWQSCNYNEWTGNHHLSTIACDSSERCLLADGAQPTCALHPVEPCEIQGARRCADADLHVCGGLFATLEGQELWRHERTCEPSQTCVQEGDFAGCVHVPVTPCSFDEQRYRCEDGGPQECRRLVGAGPADSQPEFWAPILEPCADDETCSSDGSMVYCVASPAEACSEVGATRCVGGREQHCKHGTGGMMGPPTPQWVWRDRPCP